MSLSKEQRSAKSGKMIDRIKFEKILGIAAIFTILLALFVGRQFETGKIEPQLKESIPQASSFKRLSTTIYSAFESSQQQKLIGYVCFGEADGYGGPIKVALAVDTVGKILSVNTVAHYETSAYFKKVVKSNFFNEFSNRTCNSTFRLGKDIDGVTSATYSSKGIANAIWQSGYDLAINQLNIPTPPPPSPKFNFGLPEFLVLLLFALGYYGHQRHSKYKKQIRWISLLTGLFFLGFYYNKPITISLINKLLMGFWPSWYTELYWYLLIGGVLFVFTVKSKNSYCEWFCPFGAAQECLGVLGKAKHYHNRRFKNVFTWLQRSIAWLAIVIALLYRSPGLTTYEPYSAMFDLVGSPFQFVILGVALLLSLFIRRPWCKYLCPIPPIESFTRVFMRWGKDVSRIKKRV